MPHSLDILFERLKQFDEVILLELLDITSEDILNKFKDRVKAKREQLYGEIEILNIDDPELEEEHADEEYSDGYQIIDTNEEEE